MRTYFVRLKCSEVVVCCSAWGMCILSNLASGGSSCEIDQCILTENPVSNVDKQMVGGQISADILKNMRGNSGRKSNMIPMSLYPESINT